MYNIYVQIKRIPDSWKICRSDNANIQGRRRSEHKNIEELNTSYKNICCYQPKYCKETEKKEKQRMYKTEDRKQSENSKYNE